MAEMIGCWLALGHGWHAQPCPSLFVGAKSGCSSGSNASSIESILLRYGNMLAKMYIMTCIISAIMIRVQRYINLQDYLPLPNIHIGWCMKMLWVEASIISFTLFVVK